ncbi:MAG: hypothetical protein ACYDIC_14780 [Desulfobaccales bacterium]
MRWNLSERRVYLNLISAIILLVGLGSASWIYHHAGPDESGVYGYEEANDALYPLRPEDSKEYLREMEFIGGKANVIVDKFRRWFVGLWQGKSLAVIISCATLMISFGFFLAANYRPPS